ncbi:unnamed protein product, partial [Closterium sp. NIES-54]
RPRWAELLRSGVAIFDLDFDAIISAMYALSFSAEGDCYWCVLPDPGIAAGALGASVTTLTPLPAPVPVRLADPTGGPVVASSSTVLSIPTVLFGSLSGLHLPSFSTNLVSTAALQDAMVTTTTPGGQRVSICLSTRMGRHLATFTRRPGSSLYTLATEPPQVSASPAALTCPTLSSLRRGTAARRSSLLLVSPDNCSPADPPHGFHLQLRARFGQDLPVLRLHSDRGGEFSSDLLRDFCRGEGISQSFTLPDSPEQNGIVERRIGLVMELNLWPHVSLPETSPTLCWTGKVGDASVFRVRGSRAFVRDTSADKLSARTIPCIFRGFVLDVVTFDESVPFYCLFPYRSAPSPPPPLFLAPGPPPVDPLPPQGPAPSGVSQVDPLPGTAPVQVAVGSGATPGAASRGAASRGADPGGAGSEDAGSGGAEPEGAELEGAQPGVAEPRGAASSGGPAGALPRLSSQQLLEWLVQRAHRQSGAPGAGAPRGAGVGGAAVTTGVGDPMEPGAAGAGGAGARVAGVGGPGAGGARAARAGAVDPGTGGAGGTERPRPYFPASPLPVPSPYTEQSGGLTECREPVSRPVSPVLTARRAPRSRPPPIPGTHTMALRPSSVPLRVPLPTPPESSVREVPDPESDRARAASPSVACLLATAVTDPSFESVAASALVAELLDFAAACRLDYAFALVAESLPSSPPSVRGECALGTDVLEDRQEDFECLAAAGSPPGSLPGSPPAFKARYVARGFSQRQGVDYFQTFSPTPKMTTLRVLLHVAAQRDYELHSLDFSTAFVQGSLHEEIWQRRPPGFTGSFPTGT